MIDNPVDDADLYSTGDLHIGWATLDMVPLFMERLRRSDSRIMPRILSASRLVQRRRRHRGAAGHQDRVRPARQESGLRQNSPSHYFALNMLVAGGVQPSEVNISLSPKHAFQAAARVRSSKEHLGRCLLGARHLQSCNVRETGCLSPRKRRTSSSPTSGSPEPISPRTTRNDRRLGAAASSTAWTTEKHANRQTCAELMAEGYNIQGRRSDQHAQRRSQHQLGRELSVLLESEQPDQFRACLAAILLSLPAPRLDHPTSRSRSIRCGFLGHRKAGQRTEILVAKGRVSDHDWPQGGQPGESRVRRDSAPTRSSSTFIPMAGI